MSYDPLEPEVRDKIRRIVGDTSDSEIDELFPDETYDKVISEYTNWKYAAADMAESAAVKIEKDPDNINFPGEMATGWGDRTRSLRVTAARLRSEADSEDDATSTTAVPYMPPLTPVEWR